MSTVREYVVTCTGEDSMRQWCRHDEVERAYSAEDALTQLRVRAPGLIILSIKPAETEVRCELKLQLPEAPCPAR